MFTYRLLSSCAHSRLGYSVAINLAPAAFCPIATISGESSQRGQSRANLSMPSLPGAAPQHLTWRNNGVVWSVCGLFLFLSTHNTCKAVHMIIHTTLAVTEFKSNIKRMTVQQDFNEKGRRQPFSPECPHTLGTVSERQ